MPRSVHNLAANTDKRNFEDLLKKTAEAIFMAKCLKFNGFFSTGAGLGGGGGGGDRSADFVFIASLLLRHLQACQKNIVEDVCYIIYYLPKCRLPPQTA